MPLLLLQLLPRGARRLLRRNHASRLKYCGIRFFKDDTLDESRLLSKRRWIIRESARRQLPHSLEECSGWMPRGTALYRYSVSERDLDGIDFIEKKNPYSQSSQPLLLYKERAVFKKALVKWGSREEIQRQSAIKRNQLFENISNLREHHLNEEAKDPNRLSHLPERLRAWVSTLSPSCSTVADGGSRKVVALAIGGNLVVACSKMMAFIYTGSASMLSESIHSIADLANQCLLAIGMSESKKDPDMMHPYGYSSEKYVWALISGVGIFFIGCGVSIQHGILGLMDPAPVDLHSIVPVVLGFSLLVEGFTLSAALKEIRKNAILQRKTTWEYIRIGSDPTTTAVLVEDGAAVLGIVTAASSLALTYYTGSPLFDAFGSIGVGSLLGVVAFFLIRKNRQFLLGRSIDSSYTDAATKVLQDTDIISSVHDVKAVFLGPDSFRFKAEVLVDGQALAKRCLSTLKPLSMPPHIDNLEQQFVDFGDIMVQVLGDEIDRMEASIREKVPQIRHVDIEVI